MNNENAKKYYQVTASCDYTQCVRILANSKEEAEELFSQGDWFEDDLITENYENEKVIRVDEELK